MNNTVNSDIEDALVAQDISRSDARTGVADLHFNSSAAQIPNMVMAYVDTSFGLVKAYFDIKYKFYNKTLSGSSGSRIITKYGGVELTLRSANQY